MLFWCVQVLNAQSAGYDGVIVYNYDNTIMTMGGGESEY